MTDAATQTPAEIPAKPYLLRAIYEWCADNGYTPYLTVRVDDHCQVPRAHVKDGHITLNIGMLATPNLEMGNDFIEFTARFNGVAQQVSVPVTAVAGLYAQETGAGMPFEPEPFSASRAPAPRPEATPSPEPPSDPARPRFRLVN